MSKHGADASRVFIGIGSLQVNEAMGEADFRREFKERIIQIKSAAVLDVEIKNIRTQAVVLDFFFLGSYLHCRFNSANQVHP